MPNSVSLAVNPSKLFKPLNIDANGNLKVVNALDEEFSNKYIRDIAGGNNRLFTLNQTINAGSNFYSNIVDVRKSLKACIGVHIAIPQGGQTIEDVDMYVAYGKDTTQANAVIDISNKITSIATIGDNKYHMNINLNCIMGNYLWVIIDNGGNHNLDVGESFIITSENG
jgi:hypothetical protein